MMYVLLANLAATLFMVGVIWFVQVVHYPLFSRVGSEKFSLYPKAHSRLTTYVVGPPMLVEQRLPSCSSFAGPILCRWPRR
jgi:hypothetical protein